MQSSTICGLFRKCFREKFRTEIVGGASEPFYQPAVNGEDLNRVYFRADYVSSALHEIAHWCIAGIDRRQQPDYGYWYFDDRNLEAQLAFEQSEARPQALEWIFSEASCNQFRVSCDNFDERVLDFDRFRVNVQFEVHRWLKEGLPRRANKFTRALLTLTGRHQALDPVTYKEPPQ